MYPANCAVQYFGAALIFVPGLSSFSLFTLLSHNLAIFWEILFFARCHQPRFDKALHLKYFSSLYYSTLPVSPNDLCAIDKTFGCCTG